MLTDEEIALKINDFLDELEAGQIATNRSLEEGVWLLEAALNYNLANIDLIDYHDLYQFDFDISGLSEFSNNSLYDVYIALKSQSLDSNTVLLSSVMDIGLIDLSITGDVIRTSIHRIADRSQTTFEERWLCHPAEEYAFRSDPLPNGTYTNCCFCPNEYPDNIGVNDILTKITSAALRGYGCPTENFLIPCPDRENFIVSVGDHYVNASAPATGPYSASYPYLMPHTAVTNWNWVTLCHSGVAIRHIARERLPAWISNHCQLNYPNYSPLRFQAFVPTTPSGNTVLIQSGFYTYGRCIWSGRPKTTEFTQP